MTADIPCCPPFRFKQTPVLIPGDGFDPSSSGCLEARRAPSRRAGSLYAMNLALPVFDFRDSVLLKESDRKIEDRQNAEIRKNHARAA
ncbi:hypothetical protein FAZ78_13375 [Cereibacter changlensis]|uniref:Uncharacterized protein n=1 Tax=Cereibacter changlensis TaxID=402884 RepID=A0A4U0Z173_9RHOB|nr:hypothetical protein [Cereibacter changlensis]TKA96081.1 hypothetical protein FAZ78_13375 [Cereibacter changlensis]